MDANSAFLNNESGWDPISESIDLKKQMECGSL